MKLFPARSLFQNEPASRFVVEFIGQGRFVAGRLLAPDTVETTLGTFKGNRAYAWPKGSHVEVLLRPDDVTLRQGQGVECEILDRAFRGAETLYTLRLPDGAELLSLMPSHEDYAVGSRTGVSIDVEHLVLFKR